MLRTARLRAAGRDDGALFGVPFTYVLDALAQRWGIPPWVLEDAPIDWLIRGLEFLRIEGPVSHGAN